MRPEPQASTAGPFVPERLSFTSLDCLDDIYGPLGPIEELLSPREGHWDPVPAPIPSAIPDGRGLNHTNVHLPLHIVFHILEYLAPPYTVMARYYKETRSLVKITIPKRTRTWRDIPHFGICGETRRRAILRYGSPSRQGVPFDSERDALRVAPGRMFDLQRQLAESVAVRVQNVKFTFWTGGLVRRYAGHP